MKVRWTTGSIRLRITPGELQALRQSETLRSSIRFPGGGGWTVTVDPTAARLALRWAGGTLVVELSAGDVERLAAPEAEGLYPPRGRSGGPRLLIEKDFPCAHPHAEEAAEPETERFTPTRSYVARKESTPA